MPLTGSPLKATVAGAPNVPDSDPSARVSCVTDISGAQASESVATRIEAGPVHPIAQGFVTWIALTPVSPVAASTTSTVPPQRLATRAASAAQATGAVYPHRCSRMVPLALSHTTSTGSTSPLSDGIAVW